MKQISYAVLMLTWALASCSTQLNFPIVLPPYQALNISKQEGPDNYGNCLLYLEGVTVLVYAKKKTPSYVPASICACNENTKYSFDPSFVNCVPTSRHSTAAKDVQGIYSFTVSINTEKVTAQYEGKEGYFSVSDDLKFTLVFNTTSTQYWELVDVILEKIHVQPSGDKPIIDKKIDFSGEAHGDLTFMNVNSVYGYGYGCSETPAVFFPNVTNDKDVQVGLALHNFQVELYGLYRNNQTGEVKFSRNVNDCVPTFSVGSSMGLIVAIVLASVLMFGFLMLNSVQTMDRFDDPKQKQILINFPYFEVLWPVRNRKIEEMHGLGPDQRKTRSMAKKAREMALESAEDGAKKKTDDKVQGPDQRPRSILKKTVVKKQRTGPKLKLVTMNRQRTHVFAPNRVLGVVCGEVPTVLRQMPNHRNRGDLFCAIDNVVVTYSIHPLKRRLVSNCLPHVLSALAQNEQFLYAGFDGGIAMVKNARHIHMTIEVDGTPQHMITFGGFLVLSCKSRNNILVLDSETGEKIFESVLPSETEITCISHPATYLDKILVGLSNGQFQLINVKSGKVIHQFTKLCADDAVTCMEQTRFADIIVIGFESGRICFYNIKYEKLLISASQEGRVTAIAFRTDGVDTMLTGNSAGIISVWDMNEMTLLGQLRNAHTGRINSLHTVLGQPFCVSTGDDNRIVKWLFDDESQSMPTLYTVLEGHADQVNYVSCYDRFKMLSAGADGSLRSFNVMRDNLFKSLGKVSDKCNSKGRINEPVTIMDLGWVRESSWDNVVCIHENNAAVSTWSTRRQAVGANILCHRRFYKSAKFVEHTATCVRLSLCGNSVFIGYSSGHIDIFNMQSGRFKGSFKDPMLVQEDSKDERAHVYSVCGIELDQRNRTLVSCDSNGIMKFWSVKGEKYEGMMSLSSGVTKTYPNRANRLIAVAFDSGDVKVVDILCRRTVRHFGSAHKSKLTALTFSPDGKWLLTADDNGFLKVWDMMNNFLIDVAKFEHACIGLTFTECGVYLITIHKGRRGAYVWSNMAMFGFYKDVKPIKNVEGDLKVTSLHYTFDSTWEPFGASDGTLLDENDGKVVDLVDHSQNNEDQMVVDSEKLTTDTNDFLIRFSGLPVTRWANLPDLDIIRSRNKPTEPVKEPGNAPFFLPSVSTVDGFVFDDGKKDDGKAVSKENVLMAKRKLLELDTPLLQSLFANLENFEDEKSMLLSALHNLTQGSISSIDFQIKSLPASAFPRFLRMCRVGIEYTVNYELIQAYLAVMLKYHGSDLWLSKPSDLVDPEPEYPEMLNNELRQLHSILKKKWGRLESVLLDNASLLQWVKSALV